MIYSQFNPLFLLFALLLHSLPSTPTTPLPHWTEPIQQVKKIQILLRMWEKFSFPSLIFFKERELLEYINK